LNTTTGLYGGLESGQTVNGYTPPAGGFYIVVNTPSATNPITYGTVAGGTSSTSYNFAAFGNTLVNGVPGSYTTLFPNPVAIALDGNAQAFISDTAFDIATTARDNYMHWITGVNNGGTTYSYSSQNLDADYLFQGIGAGVNCTAGVSAAASGSGTSTGNGSYKSGGAYNLWVTSKTSTQGICTIPLPVTTSLQPAVGTTPPVTQVTQGVVSTGPQYGPTGLAVDATDVGWVANQSLVTGAAGTNQVGEGFPDNGTVFYGGVLGFANNQATEPTGIAFDGNNNQWYTNYGSNSVSVFTSPGYLNAVVSATAISPAGSAQGAGNGGYTANGTMSGPAAIAIDPSGDVWVANTKSAGVGYSVTELIGVAAPTYVPLSAAQAAGKLGAKP
jgi:hypothetical protein